MLKLYIESCEKKNHGSSLAAIQFASTSEAAAAASELDGKK